MPGKSTDQEFMMPKKKSKKTLHLPMIPLRGLMVFPHMVLHFDVDRKSVV